MNGVREIQETEFAQAVVESDLPVLVDFYATWCGPCRALAPALEAIATSYDGRLQVVKVNVDEAQGLAAAFRIRGVPTLMVFRGGKPVDTIVGLVPLPALRKRLDAVVAQPVPAGA